jgi:hypothetical protein
VKVREEKLAKTGFSEEARCWAAQPFGNRPMFTAQERCLPDVSEARATETLSKLTASREDLPLAVRR